MESILFLETIYGNIYGGRFRTFLWF